ncbi:hypothetical protein HYALB_00006270 [Hymenoscyphus albidus]|uniref:Alpha/beta-hydrolase n=1 Tax=Hymenoscyphus albidus TaxID=595503 RepID=A0A9N9QDM6_9HELO|nr:hypothetical protein HYALB_00006270 [Hymenoscyphus albidus]
MEHSSILTTPPSNISSQTFHIAGILTDIYGLQELPSSCKSVTVLWLLNPRLKTKEDMASIASKCIESWNQESGEKKTGLLAIAFDQRNHGTREVTPLSNESWRQGNENHAQDMFSIYHGTACDTSLLIDHLGSYILLAQDDPSIDRHMVLGVSLGGHAAWQVLFSEPRITAGVVIIGCPDYINVMTDRARLSKLPTYTSTNGATFLGSKHFPQSLITVAQKYDPKSLFFGTSPIPSLSPSEQSRLRPTLESTIKGKRILVCSGADDKLVPYKSSEPFLTFLKEATGKDGWWDGDVYLEDNVYPGVGHAFSEGMVRDAIRFVNDTLASPPAAKI